LPVVRPSDLECELIWMRRLSAVFRKQEATALLPALLCMCILQAMCCQHLFSLIHGPQRL
jgi:hypothetical protein